MDYRSMEALTDLLRPNHTDADQNDGEDSVPSHVTPGSFGPAATKSAAGEDPYFRTVIKTSADLRTSRSQHPSSSSSTTTSKRIITDPKEIWQDEDLIAVEQGDELEEKDGRKKPDFEILFRQSISASDVYMQTGLKDGSSTSCEGLVVKVTLPDTPLSHIVLECKPTRVIINTPKYKLRADLPERVDDKAGTAKWDAAKSILSVTLPIIRDVD